MVPPSSHRVPRARWYSGYCCSPSRFVYRIITFSDWISHSIRLRLKVTCAVLTPAVLLRPVWPLPFSLATTHGISFDFSSSGYLDVSVPQVPHVKLWIHLTFHGSSPWGFPHSEIHGSLLIYSYPWLIAVSHVLLRLLMPRHPPYALFRLNFLANYLAVLTFLAWIVWVSSKQISFARVFVFFTHWKGFSFS